MRVRLVEVDRAITSNALQAMQRQLERQHKAVDFEGNVHFDSLRIHYSVPAAVRFLGIVNQMVKRDGINIAELCSMAIEYWV